MTTPKPVVAVLDDEPEMRKALRRLLVGCGYCVEEFAHGKDFLLSLGSRPLDCLLLDLHMAEVSGFDVLESLRSRFVRVPVIIITAHDEPGTEHRVRSLGARAYLKKPVDRDALISAVQSVIAPSMDPNPFSERKLE